MFIYLGGPLMLGAIAIAWGLVAASMAAVSNTSSFLAVRFLLGIAEAGTVPGKPSSARRAGWDVLQGTNPLQQVQLNVHLRLKVFGI